ncbi:unnamed protein product, partial [Lampetra planeri]
MSREQQQQQQPKTAGARRCLGGGGGGGGMVPPWRAAWELLSCVTRLRDPRRKRAAAGGERADRAVAPRLPEVAAPLEAPADASTGEAAPSASDRPSGTGSPHAPRRASRPQGKTSPAASRSATPPSAAAVAAVAAAHPSATSKGCSSAPERQSDDPSARPSGLSRLLASALRARRGARPGERPAGEVPVAAPCRHAAAGCSHDAASHAERRAHERSCDFRPGACPCPGATCPWRGPVKDVKAHLQAAHDTIGTLQGENIMFLASGVDLPGSASWAMMQSCLGQVFLLVLEKEPAWGAQAELRSEPGKDPRAKADERQRGHARDAPAPGHPLRRREVASPREQGFVRPQGRGASSWQEVAAPPGRPEVGPVPPPDGRNVAHPGVRRDGGRVGPAPRPYGAPASGDRTGTPPAPPPRGGRSARLHRRVAGARRVRPRPVPAALPGRRGADRQPRASRGLQLPAGAEGGGGAEATALLGGAGALGVGRQRVARARQRRRLPDLRRQLGVRVHRRAQPGHRRPNHQAL